MFAPAGPLKPVAERVLQDGSRIVEYEFPDPQKDVHPKLSYLPLMAYNARGMPELVVELARLADEPIDAEAVMGWAEVYGLLGCSEEEDVVEGEGLVIKGHGRRDSVVRFAEAAGEVRACLRAYEAATAEGAVDLEKLGKFLVDLPQEDLQSQEPHKSTERAWLFGLIARIVQKRLHEHCYPQLVTFTRSRLPSGRFAFGHGFKSLLGAIWLQMAWLLCADDDAVARCKLFDCRRVIHFEPGEPPPPEATKGTRGKSKTRKDREFCKGRPCKQNYWYRKNAGWEGYI